MVWAAPSHAATVFAGAELAGLRGTLSIQEQRCPADSGFCDRAQARIAYSAVYPLTRTGAGARRYGSGLRAFAVGHGSCTAEGGGGVVTGPDGSQQILGPALRIARLTTGSTALLVDTRGRLGRVAWLDPIDPNFTCGYLGDPASKLAVPAPSAIVPRALSSGLLSARRLARSHFHVVISGSKTWDSTTNDGTRVRGGASWRLQADFVRPALSGPSFVG